MNCLNYHKSILKHVWFRNQSSTSIQISTIVGVVDSYSAVCFPKFFKCELAYLPSVLGGMNEVEDHDFIWNCFRWKKLILIMNIYIWGNRINRFKVFACSGKDDYWWIWDLLIMVRWSRNCHSKTVLRNVENVES